MRRLWRGMVAGLAAGLLVGCSELARIDEDMAEQRDFVEKKVRDHESRFRASGSSFLVEQDAVWLGGEAVRRADHDPFPDGFPAYDPVALTVARGPAGEASRETLRRALIRVLGVSDVRLDPSSGEELEAATAALSPGTGVVALPPPPVAVFPATAAATDTVARAQTALPASASSAALGFEGTLARDFVFEGTGLDLLDAATQALGFATWRYRDATIWFSYQLVRDFPLHVLADGEGDDARLAEALAWLERACPACEVVSHPSLGVVQVRALPSMMARVDEWVGRLNRRLTEQFAVDVSVYRLQRSGERDLSAGLDLVFGESTNSGSSRFRVFRDTVTGAELSSTLDANLGENSRVYNATLIMLNGREQVLSDQRTRTVVLARTTAVGDQGTTGDTVQEETTDLTDGFELTLRVNSLGHGRVLVSYDFAQQSAGNINELNATLRADQRDIEFGNALSMYLGDTLVMTAVEQVDRGANIGTEPALSLDPVVSRDAEGAFLGNDAGEFRAPLVGFSDSASKDQVSWVVLMQVHEFISRPPAPEDFPPPAAPAEEARPGAVAPASGA